ncbi:hypothetical protein [Hymenobacter negativus]|uniref:STAS/SEC14 domain-containing protein n=1 Tax=Hymenobacter negativus TaxID=2795026 RepID=A0ABS3QB67_9BACT|nr:hypothetical protein [Hymenobacter negativus]MBO2008477.1 hypothetical protein [Hymenobacter negativus]
MVFPLAHNLQVQHDLDLRLMRFQWVGGPANHALRAGLAYGRDMVVANKPTHTLIDFHGMPLIDIQDELWLSVHWFPKVARRPLRCVAVIFTPEQLHNQMAIEAMLWVGRHLMRFEMQVFADVPAALDWLTEGDAAAVQRLQAEWDEGLVQLQLMPLST